MDIGKEKKRIKSDPISPPVPQRVPEPEPVTPERSPEPAKPEKVPEKVYADPDSYTLEGWPEGHPVAEALKRV